MKITTTNMLRKILKVYSHCCHILLGFSVTLLLSCNSNSTTEWYFDGNIEDLMLSKADTPAGWEFDTWDNLLVVENLVVGYHAPIDEYLTSGRLLQNVLIFENQQDAINDLEENYQFFLKHAIEDTEKLEIEDWDYTPPSQFTYESPIADEFRVIFYPKTCVCGPVIGYNYDVFARYGNVVSEFSAVLENEELTGITAGEANVLPWKDVEPLLIKIDEEFKQAGKVNR